MLCRCGCRLANLSAEHSFEKGFAESLAAPGGRERLKDMLDANPPVQHPVVRTHPESGRTSLFVNRLFTSHIIGIDRTESDALLAALCAYLNKTGYTCISLTPVPCQHRRCSYGAAALPLSFQLDRGCGRFLG